MKGASIDDIEQMTKLLAGDATEQETDHVLDLMNSDPDKRRAFNKLRREWQEASDVVHHQIINPIQEVPVVNEGIVHVPSKRFLFPKRAIVKSLVFGFLLMAAMLFYFMNSIVGESQMMIYSTGEGEQKLVIVENGLEITLNENTLLSFIEGENNFQLEGEAYFALPVRGEEEVLIDMPFTFLTTRDAAFYVSSADQFQVQVDRGLVELAMKVDKQPLKIRSGQTGVYRDPFPLALKESDPNEKAWLTRRMVFQELPLTQALNIIESAYHIHFIFNASRFQACTITATFAHATLEDVLDSLSVLYGLDYVTKKHAILVTGKSCLPIQTLK